MLKTFGVIWRYIERDLVLSDGQILPAGATLAIATTYDLHEEQFYANPGLFQPERFLAQDTAKADSLGVFSEGARACPAATINEYIFKAFMMRLSGLLVDEPQIYSNSAP